MSRLLEVVGNNLASTACGVWRAVCGGRSLDHGTWAVDLRVLGSVALDSAGLRDGLCVLPATPIAERAFFAALKAPRLIHDLLNTLGSATSLQAATIGGTLSGRQRYSPEEHGSFGSVV